MAYDAPMEEMAPALPEVTTPSTSPSSRMVHYDGSARLRVSKVQEAQDRITAIAGELGGLVENQYGDAITIRVPVARFEAGFAQVLALGDVLDKRISATDVTDAFFSTELRLRTARITRDRLVTLLGKAEDEQDKLFLIREISRLTEQIDRLEGEGRLLSSLASMSRISAVLEPRSAVAWQGAAEDAAELGWVRRLSPFSMAVAQAGKRLNLDVPEGMVNLRQKGHWVAESADGARAWSGRLDNQPSGDSAFWVAAVQERVGPEFASVTAGQVGGFSTLRMVSRDDKPYVWLVGIRVNGRHIDIFEVFYPSLEQEQRHQPAVQAAFAADGGAACRPASCR